MNKIVIPVILVVTISIAGIFAFMPIDNAATVHTSLQSSIGETFRVSSGGQDLGAAGTESTFTLSCTNACIVETIAGWTTSGDEADILFVVNISGPVDILETDLTAPSNAALGDLSDGDAPSTIVDLLKIIQSQAPTPVDQATVETISVAAGGTVVVGVNNSLDGDSNVSFVVVFTGKNLGLTTPTVAFALNE